MENQRNHFSRIVWYSVIIFQNLMLSLKSCNTAAMNRSTNFFQETIFFIVTWKKTILFMVNIRFSKELNRK